MNIESAYNKMLGNRVITNNGCWLYSTKDTRDKREILVNANNRLVARISAVINHGMNLDSHELVCHKCTESNCWNPDHIYVGSTSTNTLDSVKAGTFRNPNTGKTTCKHGHELTPDNTYTWFDRRKKQLHRWCRICRATNNKNS